MALTGYGQAGNQDGMGQAEIPPVLHALVSEIEKGVAQMGEALESLDSRVGYPHPRPTAGQTPQEPLSADLFGRLLTVRRQLASLNILASDLTRRVG